MSPDYDKCPYCKQTVLKGAMRCPACKKILQTPEQREALIQKFKEPKRRFDAGKILKTIILLLAAVVIYYLFSGRIAQFLTGASGK